MIDFSEEAEQTQPEQKGPKWSFSITTIMVAGFTSLAFIPLAILLSLSFPKIQQGFDEVIENELIETSLISKNSIEKWFNELADSVIHESHTNTSKELLSTLSSALKYSDLPLNEFIETDQWDLYTQSYNEYYSHFSSMHEDFYDIFLINNEGDILFTLARETDLGTNLINGPYKDSLFAQTFTSVMNSTSTQFSDLEYYAPSGDTISGFIISPIINDKYQKVGAFALQINFESAINLMTKSRHNSMINYVINDELMLRNKLNKIDHEDILNTKIDNKLINIWQTNNTASLSTFELNETYTGFNSNSVIGIYHSLNLINKKWAIVYEVDVNDIYASVLELKQSYLYLLAISVLVTIIVSFVLAKKISTPIKKLSELNILRTNYQISFMKNLQKVL